MSVESLVIAAVVEKGSIKDAYREGLSAEDFDLYQEEFEWIEQRLERKRQVNRRVFQRRFPDFEWVTSDDRLPDLIKEFKDERTFVSVSALIDQTVENLDYHNAIEHATHMKDVLGDVLKSVDTPSDVYFKGNIEEHIEEVRKLRILRKQGQQPGIATGIPSLDHHWDGLVNGRLIVVLGRPGEGKSFFTTFLLVSAMKEGARIGFFSPEMNDYEHRCRVHTIFSADREIQEAVGCSTFRNRALMRGDGFSLKSYGNFCRYLRDEIKGEIILFTYRYRRDKISPAFIESKIEELSLDLVVIDPIYKLKLPKHRDGNRFMAIAECIDQVQTIAEFHNIPIIITNQANRQAKRGEAPHKDSSFGTDSAAQEADHVIGVRHVSHDHRMDLYCSKSRFGANFRALMKFYPDVGIFQEIQLEGSNGKYDDDAEELLR